LSNYLLPLDVLKRDYYDPENVDSIIAYAQKLIDTSLSKLDLYDSKMLLEERLGKGGFGNLLEEVYFHVRNNSDSEPDIPESGIEIKSGQLKTVMRHKKLVRVFKERIKISMIDYNKSFSADSLQESSLWRKMDRILLILFLLDSRNRIDQTCVSADLLGWEEDDIHQMSEDWRLIKDKATNGRADSLSEGDTWYLGAATAGANSTIRRDAPGGIKAKVRAFSLKPAFLNYKLGLSPRPKGPKIILPTPPNMTLDDYILDNLKGYFGQSIDDIARSIGRSPMLFSTAKDINSKLTRALLEQIVSVRTPNINGDFQQFRKGGVIEKTISLEPTGRLKESVSFPAFDWFELNEESVWEDSQLYEILSRKFFFTVLMKVEDSFPLLIGSFFWNMPSTDIETMKAVWLKTKENIQRGIYDNISKLDNPVGHVRPHANDLRDTKPTPHGTHVMKRSFWLNNDYVLKIAKRELRL